MLEILPWRILRETRDLKKSISFSVAEIEFLGKTEKLTDSAKWLWLILALLSAESSQLVCSITFAELANKVNKNCVEIYALLRQLQVMGFIQLEGLPEVFQADHPPTQCNKDYAFSLSFPLEGLLFLKKTAKIEEKYQRPPILINLLTQKKEA